jgi:hypothetical protein
MRDRRVSGLDAGVEKGARALDRRPAVGVDSRAIDADRIQ